ncbi:Plasmid recombination enzyme [Marinococcus luteus]|uniref:Plasmid recombination enzyme n=1 Tax=Marinococcus luteus TaxID=1122204 RepID=A0A1H2YBN6_9BACI|nr:plasmid recombination protein [Marinococcus luteus]SDX02450.1 Plasmid recombination enzyme [Marinococcus luteus]
MDMSISLKKDTRKTNIKHNNREFTERGKERNDHIDFSKSDRNVYLVKNDLRELYEREFGAAKDRYNEKQQRRDRKIEDYYKHVQQSKKTRPQQEMIVQIGEQDQFQDNEANREMAKDVLQEWFQDFQQRNPQLKMYNAVIHDDEASPHMHMNFVPVATGYKKGMDTQVSFDRAIKQQDATLNQTHPFEDWREREIGFLEEKINARGIDRELVGTNDYEDMNDFKAKTKELQDLEQQIEDKQAILEPMKEFEQNFDRIISQTKEKRSMGFAGAHRVEMPKEDYDELHNMAYGSFKIKDQYERMKFTNGQMQRDLDRTKEANDNLKEENEQLREDKKMLQKENKILHRAFDLLKEQFSNQKQQFADMVGRAKGKAVESLNLKKYPTNLKRDDEQKAMNQVFQEKQQERQQQQKKSRGRGPDLGM